MATPTEVDRCRRLEERDATLTSLKLTISSYSNAQPTFSALRKSSHLKELFITSSLGEHDIGRLCREVLLQNSSLEHLTLDLRECNDRGARHLADLIQYSRNLQWLSLLLNNVSEKGALRLAEALSKSTLLGFSIYATQLDLHDCCIEDSGAAHFASALESCGSLTSICIAQNGITNLGLESILRALTVNPVITLLDLHSNLIDETGATKVAAFLLSNTSLKHLVLDENHSIGSEGAKEIATALCQNSTLETLSLKSCSIGKTGAERFATTLSQNTTLRSFRLCGNVDMGDDSVELLSRGLKENTSLQTLDLSSCGVGDEGCAHIAEALVGNTTLTHLALQKNEIGVGGALALSETLALDTSYVQCMTASSIALYPRPLLPLVFDCFKYWSQ